MSEKKQLKFFNLPWPIFLLIAAVVHNARKKRRKNDPA